jgi:polyferredoxin
MNRILLSIFRSPLVPILFQIMGLIIFVALIWFSLGVTVPPGEGSKFFAQNNLVTLIIWGVWLPLLITSTAFLGRLWCTICPLELVNSIGHRIGNRFGFQKLRFPERLNRGVISVVVYSVILYMVIATRFPRVPGNVAILLISLFVVALLFGLLFVDYRSFCKSVCPAAMLLRTYGRRGIFKIGRQSSATCAECPEKICSISGCPNGLDPRKLTDSSNCTLCASCVKSCPNRNISPMIRKMPTLPRESWENYGWEVTIFAFFLSGFAIEELFHPWHFGEHYYALIPSQIGQAIQNRWLSNHINGIWSMVAVPTILWLVLGLTAKVIQPKARLLSIWQQISLSIITVIIGAQLIRAFTKFSHWITHSPTAVENWTNRLVTDPWPHLSVAFSFPETSEGLQHVHLFSNFTILIYSIVVGVLFSWFAYRETAATMVRGLKYIILLFSLSVFIVSIIPSLH